MISTIFSRRHVLEFRETFLWSLKKQLPVMILLAVLMFLLVPMILMISVPQWIEQQTATMMTGQGRMVTAHAATQETVSDFLSENYTVFLTSYAPAAATVLTLIFAPILCVVQFGYMHKKRSVDFFHALPVSRTSLLLGRWCAGIVVLFVPLILNFLIVSMVGGAYNIAVTLSSSLPWKQMLWVMLMGAAAFTSCIFFAVCSGTMFDTAVSVIGVNAGYPLLLFCGLTVANQILPGLDLGLRSKVGALTAFAPFAAAFMPFLAGERSAGFLVWWVFLAAAMLVGAILLYNRRKSETAEDNFAFQLPKIVIRFLVTGMAGIGFGLLLSSTGKNAFLIGVVAGSVIAHVIIQAIYSRGFRGMTKSFLWYGVFAVCFAAFYGVLATGMFGYDVRVPDASEVESVSVKTSIVTDDKGSSPGTGFYFYPADSTSPHELVPEITQKDNILAVTEAQKSIVGLYRSEGFPYRVKDTQGESFTITYHLKNGGTMTRTYGAYDRSGDFVTPYHAICGKITSLREYLESSDMIFYVEPEDIKSVDLHSENGGDPKSFVPDGTQKMELLNAIRQDYVDGEVNYSGSSKSGSESPAVTSYLTINFMDRITLKSNKLKKLLGTDQGPISLRYSGSYAFFRSDSQTTQLIKSFGWEK